MEHLLSSPWWQGVAGIAQICAGVIAVTALALTVATLRRMERDWHGTVRPDWARLEVLNEDELGDEEGILPGFMVSPARQILADEDQAVVLLLNIGTGPALRIDAEFESNALSTSLHKPECYGVHSGHITKMVPPQGIMVMYLRWRVALPPNGRVIISCRSRFGRIVRHVMSITATRQASGRSVLSISPVIDMPTPSGFAAWQARVQNKLQSVASAISAFADSYDRDTGCDLGSR